MKTWPLIALASFASTGCFFSTDDNGPGGPPTTSVVTVQRGTLVLDWTINGTKDPDQCAQGAATTFDVNIRTVGGAFVGEFVEACESFSTSVDLDPGDYTGDAALQDSTGADRTTGVQLNPFTILGGDVLTVPIDFPARSFFAPLDVRR